MGTKQKEEREDRESAYFFGGVSKFVKAGLGENNKTSTCWEDLLAQGLKRRGSRATRRIEVEDLHPSVGSMRQQRDVQRNDFPLEKTCSGLSTFVLHMAQLPTSKTITHVHQSPTISAS